MRRIALFGTRFTMQGSFYPEVFSREGIELVTPDSADQDYMHDKYMNELIPGNFLPETRAGELAIVDRLKDKIDIDGVILAGTELPLILRGNAQRRSVSQHDENPRRSGRDGDVVLEPISQ